MEMYAVRFPGDTVWDICLLFFKPISALFYKNKLYKNIEAQIGKKYKFFLPVFGENGILGPKITCFLWKVNPSKTDTVRQKYIDGR